MFLVFVFSSKVSCLCCWAQQWTGCYRAIITRRTNWYVAFIVFLFWINNNNKKKRSRCNEQVVVSWCAASIICHMKKRSSDSSSPEHMFGWQVNLPCLLHFLLNWWWFLFPRWGNCFVSSFCPSSSLYILFFDYLGPDNKGRQFLFMGLSIWPDRIETFHQMHVVHLGKNFKKKILIGNLSRKHKRWFSSLELGRGTTHA